MSAPGLERGLSILEYVESHSHAGFTEIMKELDLNRASLSRYLKVLLDQRYLAKVNGVYLPGERMGSFAVNREWDSQIYPLLSHISRETECFCPVGGIHQRTYAFCGKSDCRQWGEYASAR
jgi:DNA-binding IclR family transcriptional regulator